MPARAHRLLLAGLLLAGGLAGQVEALRFGYRPLQPVAAPRVTRTGWVRNPIDAFVLARLEAAGLQPAPAAQRVALIRRATYDLTGLPPTRAEVAAFVADTKAGAFGRVVDRLLASPQYGVKWGRHWLDLVRYAETDSYERDRRKPAAWRYRDYVVDAFNADKPYDRFLLEQLAGDEVDKPTLETMIATGYYRLGIWDDEPTDTLQAVYDDLDGIVDTTTRVVLGMSLGCARCHDHKRDPIPQRDYYRMLACFEGIRPYKVGGGNATTPANYTAKIPVDLGRSNFAQELTEWRRERDALVAEVDQLAREAWSRAGDDDRTRIAAERSAGLVRVLAFDDRTAPGAELTGAAIAAVDGRTALVLKGGRSEARIERPVQDDFTIAFWFRTDRPARGNPNDLRWFTGAGLVDAEVRGIVDDFGIALVADHVTAGVGRPETFVHSGGGYADSAWHHVAFTRSRASGTIVLYVDGVRVDAKRGGRQSLTRPEHVLVGRMLPGYGSFHGAIDDVHFYDRVLDERRVLALYRGRGFERATEKAVLDHVGAPEAARYVKAVTRLCALKRPVRSRVQVLCVRESGPKVAPSFVRIRGNVHAKGAEVSPGVPAIAGGRTLVARPPASGASSGRRRALAEWIVAPDNPLTARVIANRLWQYHFGRGIVRTPNDFGRLGDLPTHPKLLDWLARALQARRWSLKAMHRLIMSSAAYRMSSRPSRAAAVRDPRNDLMWRFEPRRLTAEEIRDSILAVSGELNLQLGGPSVYPKMPAEVLATSSRPNAAWGHSPPDQAARRSLFIHVKRSLLTPLLTGFDLADTDTSCPVRFTTTQPTQALMMLNSAFIQERARKLAARLLRDATTDRDRVALGLRLVTAREPPDAEIEHGLELLRELRVAEGLTGARALACYGLVLFNLNEFLYLD